MNTHEYQAKEILASYGIPSPPFALIRSESDISPAIDSLALSEGVLKIQVHAGGRGKGGGVKVGKSREELVELARSLLGMKLINNQTGPQGLTAHALLLSPLVPIEKEYYLGAIIDRKEAKAILIASPEGGMDIEEVAAKHPEKIYTCPIGLDGSLKPYQLLTLTNFMGWKGELATQGRKMASALAKAFIETDASILEINPLVLTRSGALLALDAKLSLDDNALYRHKELAALYDPTQESATEAKAKESDLTYIALEGSIGCIVNGAGLAMATMDLIELAGAKAANFLDVGGSATEEKIAAGFQLVAQDPKVRVIVINIFGGIMSCETIAAGILAVKERITQPILLRMEGTRVEEGKALLQKYSGSLSLASNLEELTTQLKTYAHTHR